MSAVPKRFAEVGDLCDRCGMSGVEIARVEDGQTICVDCDEDMPEEGFSDPAD